MKYIIKNCPCYDEINPLFSCKDETKEFFCENCTTCLIKQMYELLIEVEKKSAELSFCEFKQYIDEDFLDKAYHLFDKEDVDETQET